MKQKCCLSTVQRDNGLWFRERDTTTIANCAEGIIARDHGRLNPPSMIMIIAPAPQHHCMRRFERIYPGETGVDFIECDGRHTIEVCLPGDEV